MSKITRAHAPEEKELEKKLAELTKLEARLAQKELDLATLQAELRTFEARYLRTVGVLYAELDDVHARIAEANARLHPDVVEVQEAAKDARTHAQETAEAVGEARRKKEEEHQEDEFVPSDDLKQTYRDLAKQVHPDLASDDEDRIRRNNMMAVVNMAYESGDIERLRKILEEWETSPEAVKGDTIEARIDRAERKIARITERLNTIRADMITLTGSRLFELKQKVEKGEDLGRDILGEMAARVGDDVDAARRRLEKLLREVAEQ